MTLYKEWSQQAYESMTEEAYETFWNAYLPKEKAIYEEILTSPLTLVQGTVKSLAERFSIDEKTMVGFLDGINTSLKEPLDVEALAADSAVSLDVDLPKLYFNMHDAKADWLYNLPQWQTLLSEEERSRIRKEYNRTQTAIRADLPGRNDPCPCGSGKKYKKCCGPSGQVLATEKPSE